jgi:hypothetical protein
VTRLDTHWIFDDAGRWNLHATRDGAPRLVGSVAVTSSGSFRAKLGDRYLSASPYLDHVPFDELDAARAAVETAFRNEASR